jgi:hypothetical protein
MAARVGTASQVNIQGGNGNVDVTVPAGTTAVIAQWHHWDGGAGSTLATLTLDGVGFTFLTSPGQIAETSATNGVGLATLINPTIGATVNVAWTFSAGDARSDGGLLILTYVNAVDLTALVRDHVIAANDAADISGEVDSETDDLVLATIGNWAAPALSGTVYINNATSVSLTFDASELTAASPTTTATATGESFPSMTVISLRNAIAGEIEQEGFRFGLDDDDEAAHTWEAAQDTNITTAPDLTRLIRVLLDATDDPVAFAPTLRWQKNGTGGYVPVPVGVTTRVTPVIEASDATTDTQAAADPWPINVPDASAGDLLLFIGAWDDSTDVTSVAAPAGPNGETITSIVGPQASAGVDMRMQAWYTVCTGVWTAGTISFNPSATETARFVVIRVLAGEFDPTTPIGAADSDGSAATNETNVNSPAFTAGASDGGGRLVLAFGSDADAITAPGSGTSTVDNATASGVGLLVATRDAAVADSESIASITATIASDAWATLAFVVRAPTVTNEVYIVGSANVTGGGEATTARLTAPAGKTTGDFTAGRRWDDENGTDTVDIAENFYTEVEWAVRNDMADADFAEFRVYRGIAAADSYTVTPRWTITDSAENDGDVDAEAQAATLALAGVRSSEGDLAAAAQAATSSIVGVKLLEGDVAMQVQAQTLALGGDIITGHLGDVDADSQAAELDADGVRRSIDVGEGFGLQALAGATTIAGTRRVTGAVGVSAAPASTSLLGPRRIPGAVPLQSQAPAFAVTGPRRVIGGAAAVSGLPVVTAAGTRRITATAVAIAQNTTIAITGARVRAGGVVMTNPAVTTSIFGDLGGQISGVLTPAAAAALLALEGLRASTGELDAESPAVAVAVEGVKASAVTGTVGAESQAAGTTFGGAYVNVGAATMDSAVATFDLQQAFAGYLVGTVRVVTALSATRVRTTPGES